MRKHALVGGLLLLGIVGSAYVRAQDPSEENRTNTMRPVVRGRIHAAASMKPEATRAAERILQAGGNAFDAAVAGQAVLGIVDAASNGVGSDAVILVYDAESEAGRLDQCRGNRAEAGDDRVVPEESRRQAAGERRAACRARCRASSTPGTCCSIAGAR